MKKLILAISLMLSVLIFKGSCTQREKPPIPKEGDVVTWKFSSDSFVVQTHLGKRREHIVDTHCSRCEREFYRPEYERYLGQFSIDYIPEVFDMLSTVEVAQMPFTTSSNGAIEFNLMLNGAKAKATDRGIYSEKALDDVNQVKVVVEGRGSTNNPEFSTKDGYEKYKKSPKSRSAKITHEFGLECFTDEKTSKWCFGKSSNKRISGVSITFGSNTLEGHSWESIYGGMDIRWRIDKHNLQHWKEIDAAIWRLLDAWNVSPHKNDPPKFYVDKYKVGDIVAWTLTPQLIIKATVGQRNIKSYKDPELSHFLGQFPIHYSPTKQTVLNANDTVHLEDVSTLNNPFEFDLLLNDAKNAPINGWYGIGVQNQVKIKISNISNVSPANLYTPREWINYLLSLGGYFKKDSKFERFGLECYLEKHGSFSCIGQTKEPKHPEIFLRVDTDATNDPSHFYITSSTNTKMYGGIRVEWQTPIEHLKDWREIDAAIWRLLDTWNVAASYAQANIK